MFELIQQQWVQLGFHEDPPSCAIRIEGQIVDVYRVLQYRERVNIMEIGMQEPIWSEWKDVPLFD